MRSFNRRSSSFNRNNHTTMEKAITGFFIVIFVTLFIAYPVAYVGSSNTVTFTVTDKERVTYSSGDNGTTSKYLVFTNNETFENTDSLMFGKWNSSDIYGKLENGKTYQADVAGWRIPFISSYRNIINIREHKN